MDRIDRRDKIEKIKKAIDEITVLSHGQMKRAQFALREIVEILEEDEYFFQKLVEED